MSKICKCHKCGNIIAKTKSSSYVGVDYHKSSQRWRARYYLNGKQETIGFYILEKDAFIARETAIHNKQEALRLQDNNTSSTDWCKGCL